jgi:hypothetical protein
MHSGVKGSKVCYRKEEYISPNNFVFIDCHEVVQLRLTLRYTKQDEVVKILIISISIKVHFAFLIVGEFPAKLICFEDAVGETPLGREPLLCGRLIVLL